MDLSCSTSSSSLLVSLLVVLLLAGSSSQSPSVKKPSDLVSKICLRTANRDLCLKIFEADPRSATADIKGLVLIAIDALEASANQTLDTLGSLVNSTPASPLKDRFQTCVGNYNAVISNLETAKKVLLSPNYKSAFTPADNAQKNIQSCQTIFLLSPELTIPAELNDLAHKSLDLARIAGIILLDFLV
ncbi:pectinesterase inhibitor-like [Rhododendron vialii]|uniref:pectinesterase inhibitor-like n=1 Tax=Rhododendron vialii TaxID=182163 RepID=UPI00265EB469|nr:pectinesterase inhibitor-like [Rhododendron vialii]